MIYVNGEYFEKENAKISVFDHGFLYGDGIFEGIRVYNNLVFRLNDHLLRLYESAKTIALEIPISIEEMERAIIETVRLNKLPSCYIRLVVSRGYGDMGVDPRKCSKATVVIIVTQINIYPPELYETGLAVAIASTRRMRDDMLSPRIKSLNYLSNVMTKIEMNRQGLADGIMLNAAGYVTEASVANVFIVKKGELITPPKSVGLLEGITRNTIIELARDAGISVKEELFTQFDLYNADECFLTGTASEVIPVVSIDGRILGENKAGPLSRRLLEMFRSRTIWDGTKII
ncbi:MAG: branched-chain-amino-acid transaminase [Negativicutes bacterium]|jgi:branched-chain amino acid aminotransferase